MPLFGAHEQLALPRLALPRPALPRQLPPLPLSLGLELKLGGMILAHEEGACGPLACHPLEHALVHQPLEHSLEAPGVAGHVIAPGGNSLLQGGQGYAFACPLVCHEPQDHLGYAGLPVGVGTGAAPSLALAWESR